MENTYDNKLFIVSKPGYGQEVRLLNGRTTIGSAPGNDAIIDSPDVSGYHAEFRFDNDTFYITDFSSEKGTFVNHERIDKETRLRAGDIIQLGSTQTVLIPRNSIFAKQSNHIIDNQGTQTHKIWMVMAGLFIVVMSAFVITTIGKDTTVEAQRNELIAKEGHPAKDGFDEENEKKNSTPINTGLNETGSSEHPPNSSVDPSTGSTPKREKVSQQDIIASICFKIGKRFSDYQLWSEALNYYRMVSENIPDYPELSAEIAKMQLEKTTETAYQQGLALIEKGSYTGGITELQKIDQNSFYYNNAVQAIAEAKEKTMQSSKENQ